ncbi:MAG: preprotein translocase subunit YajC [Gammaproteobacteria bacterium]|nr:preprotein translocase subunit YajC [Gammaproteobacteria bacterium]
MFPSVYAAAESSAPQVASNFSMFFLMGSFFLIFYFMIIRPKQKREQEQNNILGKLDKGDEVITYSGIMGKITRIKDDYIVLNIADNVEIKMQKTHIRSILPKGTLKAI